MDFDAKLKFSPIGQIGQKQYFQEFLGGRTKLARALSFLDQLTPIFLQMEGKTYILVVQSHSGADIFMLMPNLKCEVKLSREF